jgi:hypothetical protein
MLPNSGELELRYEDEINEIPSRMGNEQDNLELNLEYQIGLTQMFLLGVRFLPSSYLNSSSPEFGSIIPYLWDTSTYHGLSYLNPDDAL